MQIWNLKIKEIDFVISFVVFYEVKSERKIRDILTWTIILHGHIMVPCEENVEVDSDEGVHLLE